MYVCKLVSGPGLFRTLRARKGFRMEDCLVGQSPFCFFLAVVGDEPQLVFEAEQREDFLRIASFVAAGSLLLLVGNGFVLKREDANLLNLMSKVSGCPVVVRECKWKPNLQELWDSVK